MWLLRKRSESDSGTKGLRRTSSGMKSLLRQQPQQRKKKQLRILSFPLEIFYERPFFQLLLFQCESVVDLGSGRERRERRERGERREESFNSLSFPLEIFYERPFFNSAVSV